jgi:hypothetical protein
MIFHIGKIYKIPNNFFFYKSNQPKIFMEYCKKIKIPKNIPINTINNSYITLIFDTDYSESSESSDSDNSWIDLKKNL